MALPSRDVPEGLSPNEYYQLGIQYKSMGWTEQARDALTMAQEEDTAGEVSAFAKRYLRTKLPKFPVPLLAEQKNIQGFNQMALGDIDDAKHTFEELIRDFPDFEWPYGNLARLCLQEGNTLKATKLLEKALQINPAYVNGWLHLATAKGLELDFEGARQCVTRALSYDPSDQSALAMQDALERLTDVHIEDDDLGTDI